MLIHTAGGLQQQSFVFLYVPVVLAGLVGERPLVLMAAVAIGTVLMVEYFQPLEALRPFWIFPREASARLVPVDLLATLTLMTGFTYAFMRSTERAQERAEAAVVQLEVENAIRAAAEKTARMAAAEAQQAAQAKSAFLAMMSHELRTPMNGVLGMSQLMLETELPGEAREQAEVIQGCAESLLVVVNDILDLSKLEAGKLLLDPRPLDLGQLTQEVLGILRHARAKPGVELRRDAPDALWVSADEARLRQLLMNLVGNAVKFTEEGSVTLRLRTRDKWLRFEVEDTGIGIPADRQEKLFLPFEQADASTARRFGGTGLGLSISKHLVEHMGGTIGVRSTLGEGSTFWFEIPLSPAERPLESAQARSCPLRGSGTVLVVDDNPVNRKVAARMVERLGFDAETVDGGQAAIDRARRGGLSFVLMDVQMPEVDGLEATRRIRADEATSGAAPVTIVGLSANVFPEDAQKGLDAGMDAYLGKPIERDLLRRTLLGTA